jgi:hypothetical protein
MAELFRCRRDRGQDGARLGEQDGPGFGQANQSPAPVEQRRPDLLFEIVNAVGHRRLDDANGLGGAAETGVLGDGNEIPKRRRVHGSYE